MNLYYILICTAKYNFVFHAIWKKKIKWQIIYHYKNSYYKLLLYLIVLYCKYVIIFYYKQNLIEQKFF